MAPVDLERFRAAYLRNIEAMNHGELEAAFAWVSPELEWHVLADSLPADIRPDSPPVLRGRHEVIDFMRHWREDWDWSPQPVEFIDPGDGTVVVRAFGTLRGRASGLLGEAHFRQVWELDEDGVPLAVRERLDEWFLRDLPPPTEHGTQVGPLEREDRSLPDGRRLHLYRRRDAD